MRRARDLLLYVRCLIGWHLRVRMEVNHEHSNGDYYWRVWLRCAHCKREITVKEESMS